MLQRRSYRGGLLERAVWKLTCGAPPRAAIQGWPPPSYMPGTIALRMAPFKKRGCVPGLTFFGLCVESSVYELRFYGERVKACAVWAYQVESINVATPALRKVPTLRSWNLFLAQCCELHHRQGSGCHALHVKTRRIRQRSDLRNRALFPPDDHHQRVQMALG